MGGVVKLKAKKLPKKEHPALAPPPAHAAGKLGAQLFLGATAAQRVPFANSSSGVPHVEWLEPGAEAPRRLARAPAERALPIAVHQSEERCLVEVGAFTRAHLHELDLVSGELRGPILPTVVQHAAYVGEDGIVTLVHGARGAAAIQLYQRAADGTLHARGRAAEVDDATRVDSLRAGKLVCASGLERVFFERRGDELVAVATLPEEPLGDVVSLNDDVFIVDAAGRGAWAVQWPNAAAPVDVGAPTLVSFDAAAERLIDLPREPTSDSATSAALAALGIVLGAPAKRTSELLILAETRDLALTLYELAPTQGPAFAAALQALDRKRFARGADLAEADQPHARSLIAELKGTELAARVRARALDGNKPVKAKAIGSCTRLYAIQYDGDWSE